jgi:hypothetical protein
MNLFERLLHRRLCNEQSLMVAWQIQPHWCCFYQSTCSSNFHEPTGDNQQTQQDAGTNSSNLRRKAQEDKPGDNRKSLR